MTADDYTLIHTLNAVYAHALDGLLPDSATAWANTFAADGAVSILDSHGGLIAQAKGTERLIALWKSFPDPATTRHWFNNIVIEPDGDLVQMRAYIIALNIGSSPAVILRTGTYRDVLTRQTGAWKFRERSLTLDPASHV
jgi:hypothetical protein